MIHHKEEESMEKHWSYKDHQIDDGLKPGSSHFQYFYRVSEKGRKKCTYCVWIEDEALSRFGSSRDFDPIVSSQREAWNTWVKGKIDAGDFASRVLKIEKDGEKEIDLSELSDHLSME
jgi:hypothetical protein